MDLDGDGNQDILSGSWPGELYFFKGKDKKPINIDKAPTVFASDWRGTGRLDLSVGGIKVSATGAESQHGFVAEIEARRQSQRRRGLLLRGARIRFSPGR